MTLSEEATDALFDRMISLQQHLDGAPHPMQSAYGSWDEHYKCWYNRAQELVNGK